MEAPRAKIFRALKCGGAIAVCIATILAAAYSHKIAGFGLPPPWEDESVFLWPALSFANNSTLYSENLNPERPVFFMLMGYSVILGSLFKILPFTLEIGRWISLVWLLGSTGLLAWMVRRFPLRGFVWLIIIWFALSRPFVVASNFVRPEAFCTLLVCLAMAIGNKRPWIALAVLGVTPLVHPNGVWFTLLGVGAIAIIQPNALGRMRRMDMLVLGCAGLSWMLMGMFALKHWDGFINDFGFSLHAYPEPLAQKATRLLLRPNVTPFFLICIGSTLFWRKRKPEIAWMGALGAALLFVPTIRIQMWYAIYTAVGQEIALFMLIVTIAEWDGHTSALRRGLAILAACAGLVFIYRDGALEGPRGYPHDMTWGWGMRTEDPTVPYWTKSDRAFLANELTPNLRADTATRVAFLPYSDTMFFPEPDIDGFTAYQPVFTTVKPDIVIYRESRYIPGWVRSYYTNILFGTVRDTPGTLIHQRNQTERWTLYVLGNSAVSSNISNTSSNTTMGSELPNP